MQSWIQLIDNVFSKDFIWQFQRYGHNDSISASSSMTSMGSTRSQKSPLTMEVLQSLLDSYEAKKKYALLPLCWPILTMFQTLYARHHKGSFHN
jgi:hypothetical protein